MLFTHSGLLHSWLAESAVVALTLEKNGINTLFLFNCQYLCVKNKSVIVEHAEVVKLNQYWNSHIKILFLVVLLDIISAPLTVQTAWHDHGFHTSPPVGTL